MLKLQFLFLPTILTLNNVRFLRSANSPALFDGMNCVELLENYANSVANVTKCFIRHARPITVCQKCVDEYDKVVKSHRNITEMAGKSGQDCHMMLVNVDRLEVVETSFKYVELQWSKASCAKCFKGRTSQLNEDTQKVLQLYNNLTVCEEGNSIKYNEAGNSSSRVCSTCEDVYLELNHFYDECGGYYKFCMDIVDMMNSTRGNWSDYYKCCTDRQKPNLLFLIIAAVVCALPVIFYCLVWLWSKSTFLEFAHQTRWIQRFSRSSTP